jgi:hypothetical protein
VSTAESPRVSRGLLIVLGAVIGIAVVAVLWLFVISPLLDSDPVASPAPAPADREEPESEPTPAPDATPVPPETDEFFTARDPFQQLVATSSAPSGVGSTAPGSSDPGTSDPAPAVRVGQTSIRLVDVATVDGVTRVEVEVNGESYTAAEGETFAGTLRVLDITGSCATFLFGDSRFTLCSGETIRK